jgi:hypothetical protein
LSFCFCRQKAKTKLVTIVPQKCQQQYKLDLWKMNVEQSGDLYAINAFDQNAATATAWSSLQHGGHTAQVEIKDINIVNHTLCVAIVIEYNILQRRAPKENTTSTKVCVFQKRETEKHYSGENNKFQIVLTQKVEICCRGAVPKVIGALFQMSFAPGKIK